MRILREQKDAGNQSGAGWKAQVWTAVEAALKSKGIIKGAPKTASKSQDRYTNLKKQFVEVHALRNASGFGWDDGTKKVQASDSVWEAYLKSHPKAARWRVAPFPLYDEMHYLVNGIVATGADVFHPGQTPAPSEGGSDAGVNGPDNPGAIPATTSTTILDDSAADKIMDEDLESTTTPASTSVPSVSRKRVRADSESLSSDVSGSLKRPRGRRHTTQATSISGVGDALVQMAAALSAGGEQGTPLRRKKALKLVSEDGEYSSDEEDMINYLFCDDIRAADTYLGIVKKEKRVNFIRKHLEKHAES